MATPKKYVAFVRPSEPTIIKEGDFVDGKTVAEIATAIELNQETEILAITTPCYRETLKNDQVPSKLFPNLLQNVRPGKFTRPDFYLSILPKSYESKFTIFMNVKTKKDNFGIPPFEVNFDPSNTTVENILNEAKAQFRFGVVKASLISDGKKIKKDKKDKLKLDQLRTKQLTMKVEIDDKSKSKIKTRINITNEIQTTETTYLKGLETLEEKWHPILEKEKMMNQDELNQVFNDLPTIINCHKTFYKDIFERSQNLYGAMLSDVFLDFAAFFKISLHYISNYSSVIQLILRKSKNKEWDTKLTNIGQDIGPLQSYLITPVQRMPRYILFLRELIKVTPESHPDCGLLAAAEGKIKQITEEIDRASNIAENKAKLAAIQMNMDKSCVILTPTRTLVSEYSVSVEQKNKSSKYKGQLYLFNDLVLLTNAESKTSQKSVFEMAIILFRYIDCPSKKDITLFSKSKPKDNPIVVSFSKQEEKDQFIQNFTKLLDDNYESLHIENKLPFKLVKTNHSLSLCSGNDVCILGNELYSYSNSYFISVNLKTGEVTNINAKIDTKSGHSMTALDDSSFLIYGGKAMGEPIGSIYMFSKNNPNFVDVGADNTPEPRYGHSAVMYKGKLFVFGGISHKKKTLNDLCVYDPLLGRWAGNNPLNDSPPPRAFHSSFVYNDKMYIYGGCDSKKKTFLNDVYALDLIDLKWSRVEIQLPPRAFHRTVMVGSMMVTIGGSNKRRIVPTTIVKLDEKELVPVKGTNCYNNPPTLTRFGMDYLEPYLYIYGGETARSSDEKTNGLFMIEVPHPNSLSKTEATLSLQSPRLKRSLLRIPSIHLIRRVSEHTGNENDNTENENDGENNNSEINEEEEDEYDYDDDDLLGVMQDELNEENEVEVEKTKKDDNKRKLTLRNQAIPIPPSSGNKAKPDSKRHSTTRKAKKDDLRKPKTDSPIRSSSRSKTPLFKPATDSDSESNKIKDDTKQDIPNEIITETSTETQEISKVSSKDDTKSETKSEKTEPHVSNEVTNSKNDSNMKPETVPVPQQKEIKKITQKSSDSEDIDFKPKRSRSSIRKARSESSDEIENDESTSTSSTPNSKKKSNKDTNVKADKPSTTRPTTKVVVVRKKVRKQKKTDIDRSDDDIKSTPSSKRGSNSATREERRHSSRKSKDGDGDKKKKVKKPPPIVDDEIAEPPAKKSSSKNKHAPPPLLDSD
ncbi:hypothetical protein TRFO_07534 [Tritrichomonas foetus]|uniref:DH domain-containing protein n=1 Tax=Tritrichomonas foetus TaxID=1144522 RepID=A0A1J4JS81_9EUKA|nr:hypothetical protein TRFO_07534 [Tritrichomonas foetus]|eukprot:OHT01618.1 hypothetical protein TRFO_07534 [Tritrichomonas foetus]